MICFSLPSSIFVIVIDDIISFSNFLWKINFYVHVDFIFNYYINTYIQYNDEVLHFLLCIVPYFLRIKMKISCTIGYVNK